MNATLSLQIDTKLLSQLDTQLRQPGGVRDMSEAINTAIAFWLDAQAPVGGGVDPAATRGYQWKSLFLPKGTELRCFGDGEYHYARVEGDEVIYRGCAVSPNQFIQAFARSARNAWAEVYLRRPGEKVFILASRLRREAAAPQMALPAPQAVLPAPPQAAASDPVSQFLSALLSHGAAVGKSPVVAPSAALAAAAPQRPGDFEPGWDLPERRKFRLRLDDVAY